MSRELSIIRRVIDLLALLRQPGRRLVRQERWEIDGRNGWYAYRVQLPDGDYHPVDERIAVAADRKGLVRVVRQSEINA